MELSQISFPTVLRNLTMLVLLSVVSSGCLTTNARKARKACIEGDCNALRLINPGQMSAKPDELDQKDTQQIFKALSPNEANDGVTVLINSRRQCRALRYTTDFYAFPKGSLFWTDVGILVGGGAAAGSAFAFEGGTKWAMLGLGSGMAIYGMVDLIGRSIYARSEVTRKERGEFIDCEDWIDLPPEGEVHLSFPSINAGERSLVPLSKLGERHIVPEFGLGFAHLQSPFHPAVDFQATLQKSSNNLYFLSQPPAKRAWVCEAMRKLSAIQTHEDPRKWKLLFQFSESSPPASLNWNYSDGQTVFGAHRDFLTRCPQATRDHILNLANSVISENPQTYGIFASNLQGIIRQPLYKPSPNARQPIPQQKVAVLKSSKTTSKSKRGSGYKGRKIPKQKTNKVAKKDDFGKQRAPSGRYRCMSDGRIANLTIRRDGSFRLVVQLENGSAVGFCDSKRCLIRGVKGSALRFTEGFKTFRLQRLNSALLLNGRIRCEMRPR